MSEQLDRPVWRALTTRHAHLAEGGATARRYRPDISLFAATRDDEPGSLAALADLVRPGETALFMQASPIRLPEVLAPTLTGDAVQMVADKPFPFEPDPRIERLAEHDAAEMLDLALLTKPGPFTMKAQSLGRFWGIRIGGRLVAMAGERMKAPGLTELSGVCTHPQMRGRGCARILSLHVMQEIFAAGDRAFLHAWANNTAAIGLYESIGFTLRAPMHVAATVRA